MPNGPLPLYMPRTGPISLDVHGALEPTIAAVFIAAPFVLGFDDGNAKWLSIGIGIAILLSGMMTKWRVSVVKVISLRAHYALDVVVGVLCLVAPFAFGFSDETAALVFFLVMGLGEFGAIIATGWDPDPESGELRRPTRSRTVLH
jgi:hypothetical protein